MKNKVKHINIVDILFFLIIVVICISNAIKAVPNDTFYTIKVGETIQTSGIDGIDHFSFHDNLPYTYPHWLYDLGIYKLYDQFGFDGLYIFNILCYIALALLVYFISKKITKNKLFPFLYTLFMIFALKNFEVTRAQQITLIIFPIVAYFLEQYVATDKKRYAIGIILSALIIANVHVAVYPFLFILFLPYIAEYLLVKLREKTSKKKKESTINSNMINHRLIMETDIKIKNLFIVMAISLLMGFITPLGTTPYTYLLKTMMGVSQSYISEHLPVVLIDNSNFCIFLICLAIMLMFSNVKLKWREFFMLSGLILLALSADRHQSLLFTIGGIYFLQILVRMIDGLDTSGSAFILNFFNKKVVASLTLILVLTFSYFNFRKNNADEYISEKKYPIEAADWINNNLDVKNLRMYNEYGIGSYLLFKGIPVFIDSRADLYTKEFNGKDDIITSIAVLNGFDEVVKKYDLSHILLRKVATLNSVIEKDNHYKIIYQDDNFLLYKVDNID